ncbi:MAG: hypothetical protein V8S95_04315 [Odoribacter sp.]
MEIADQLGISVNSVKTLKYNVFSPCVRKCKRVWVGVAGLAGILEKDSGVTEQPNS